MAQADGVISNASGAAVRADLNNQLAAVFTNHSGATEPTTTYAYQWWADTTTGLLKIRNAANSAWVTVGTLADVNLGLLSASGGTLTGALLAAAGSATTPSISFSGDTNTGIYSPGADQVSIATGGAQRLAIDSSGNIAVDTNTLYVDATNNRVGIGTTSPVTALHVTNSTNSDRVVYVQGVATGLRLGANTNGAVIEGVDATDGNTSYKTLRVGGSDLLLQTGGTERARIDSSGRLLVGTSTARSNFFNSTNSSVFQVEGTGETSTIRNLNDVFGPMLLLGKSRSTGNTIVQNGDTIGLITFQGNDGSEFVECATIKAEVDGTPGANDMPGRLVFSTTADGASSPTERMRIDSVGAVLIGTSASDYLAADSGIQLQANGTARFGTDGTTSRTVISFVNGTNGTPAEVGKIQTSGSSTTYATSSDYRLKENVVPLTGAAVRLNQLQVHRFNFIADPDTTVDGFIAHEAQAVVPECVTGTKDEVDADGNPVYQGIDQSKLVPLLTAALQEALAKIETLEARLTAAGI